MAARLRRKRRVKRAAPRSRPGKPSRAGKRRKATPTRRNATKTRKAGRGSKRSTKGRVAKAHRRAGRKATRKVAKAVRRSKPPIKSVKTPSSRSRPRTTERPALDRTRRVLPDDERLDLGATAGATGAQDRMLSAARSGHDELRQELGRHTQSSPVLTAGDVDARWQDAYAVGDEAPGGDNPTPDQDRVDDIGRALGIQYQDDQELMGGDEVTERDKHRWELDPASSEDWPHDKDKEPD